MKVNIIGGGPAGLYFAILLKQQDAAHTITLYERDAPTDTFGFGVVFSQKTMNLLRENDPESYAEITPVTESWDHVAVVHRGEKISVRGNVTYGIRRLAFLNVLQKRAAQLGIALHFRAPIDDAARLEELAQCDLLVGADGVNSLVRRTYSDFFLPMTDLRQNKYIWLGTNQPFDGLTLTFRETNAGLFIAHSYRFSKTNSTFIVEVPSETWLRAGLVKMSEAQTLAYLADVFQDDLARNPLFSNNSKWINFPLLKNKRWYFGNRVLLGDALHTAHFSIGSGTKLALEDAIALAQCCAAQPTIAAALPEFQRVRKPMVDQFQDAALKSLSWLENVQSHMPLDPVPFTYGVVTRSNRVGYNRLKRQAPEFIARYEAWRNQQPSTGPIPREFVDIFQKESFGHLVTLMPDGTPQVTSVWVDYDGKYILINSAKGRQKDLNMERNPIVALQIPDPDNPNRYIGIRGRVVEITEAGADEHLDKLARRYIARDKYPATWRFPNEVRRIYKIEPQHVLAWEPFG
ncbi:MAG: TIGR03618 family F420-dependent PPOX class oxidoreductase [Chloroflexota bacterium]|nr:TIGR03618 family F420-dependent PPOX class oxidoreductase [Chloroflexota bacterium]